MGCLGTGCLREQVVLRNKLSLGTNCLQEQIVHKNKLSARTHCPSTKKLPISPSLSPLQHLPRFPSCILTIYLYEVLLKYFMCTIEIHVCFSTSLFFYGASADISIFLMPHCNLIQFSQFILSCCGKQMCFLLLLPMNKVLFMSWFQLISM